MEKLPLKLIKQKRLSNKTIFLSMLYFMLSSCGFRDGTYYEYLAEAPLVTTDKRLAMQKQQIVAEKKLNDTTYYYYTEGEFHQTKDYAEAQKGYITVIKNIKNGKPLGIQVVLDGLGDTMIVDYYDKRHLDSLHISYYGNKKMKLYHEFKDGRKNGVAKCYYPNGVLQQIAHWADNVQEGECISYHPNGYVESKGNYNNGVRDGVWVYFDEHGDTIKVEVL